MFKSNRSWYFIGAALSQLLTLIASFYIVKGATASVFGEFSFFVSLATIIGSVSTLKFEQAIVVSNSITDSVDKFRLTIQIALIINLLLMPLAFFALGSKVTVFDLFLVFVVANNIVINASIQQAFLFLEGHFYNGLFNVCYSFFNLVFVYLLIHKPEGLQISYTLAYVVSSVIFLLVLIKFSYSFKFISYKSLLSLYKRNKQYPIYIFPGAVLSIFLTYGHPVFISYIYSNNLVGLFSISNRILMLPIIVVSSVVSGLFRVRLSKLYFSNNRAEIYKQSVRALKFLGLSAVIIYPVLVYVIMNINSYIKLTGWNGIEKVAPLLGVYVVAQYFYIPMCNIPLVCERKKLLFRMNLYQFILNIIVYLLSYLLNFSFSVFLSFLSGSMFVFSFIACIVFLGDIKKEHKEGLQYA
ncbi:MAG: lipopolysaccharide biosynthesis protein [Mucilaginibacter sp.]